MILHVHRHGTRDWAAAHVACSSIAPPGSTGSLAALSPLARNSGSNSARSGGGSTGALSARSAKSALHDYCQLGGLQRVVVSATELSRCGLAPARERRPSDVSSASSGEFADDLYDDGCESVRGDGLHVSSMAGSLSPAVEGRDAKVFVLCVQRMQRKRSERSKAMTSSTGSLFGGGGPLSPTKSAAANGGGFASRSEGVDDALSVEPFEIWTSVSAPTPPGAPSKSIIAGRPRKGGRARGSRR